MYLSLMLFILHNNKEKLYRQKKDQNHKRQKTEEAYFLDLIKSLSFK